MSPLCPASPNTKTPATVANLVRRVYHLDLLAARIAARKAQIIHTLAQTPAAVSESLTTEDADQLHADLSRLYALQNSFKTQ